MSAATARSSAASNCTCNGRIPLHELVARQLASLEGVPVLEEQRGVVQELATDGRLADRRARKTR